MIAGTNSISENCAILSRSSRFPGLLSKGKSTRISDGGASIISAARTARVLFSELSDTGTISIRISLSPALTCRRSRCNPRQDASSVLKFTFQKICFKIFLIIVSICRAAACVPEGRPECASGKATISRILSRESREVDCGFRGVVSIRMGGRFGH